MRTIVVTKPQQYPISLGALKSSLRVDWGDDDAILNDIIAAATNWVEHGLGRRLITQTLSTAIYLPELLMTPIAGVIGTFDGYATEIPWAPVQSVTKVEIETQISSWYTLTQGTDYLTDVPDGLPSKIYLATSALANWAVALNYPGNRPRIRATYIAGYGDDPSSIPAAIRLNCHRVAAWMYQHRDGEPPPDSLLDMTHKVWRL